MTEIWRREVVVAERLRRGACTSCSGGSWYVSANHRSWHVSRSNTSNRVDQEGQDERGKGESEKKKEREMGPRAYTWHM